MMRWTMVLAMVGCATPEPEESPLAGPGFDEVTGVATFEQDTVYVGLTHLQVRNAPGPGSTFGAHADAVGNHLFVDQPEGWLGAAFRNVGRLNWWTITVWEDEVAMLEFVISEPHASAMADFGDIVVGGESRSLEMPASEIPLSWDRALEMLLDQPDFVAGETAWAQGRL